MSKHACTDGRFGGGWSSLSCVLLTDRLSTHESTNDSKRSWTTCSFSRRCAVCICGCICNRLAGACRSQCHGNMFCRPVPSTATHPPLCFAAAQADMDIISMTMMVRVFEGKGRERDHSTHKHTRRARACSGLTDRTTQTLRCTAQVTSGSVLVGTFHECRCVDSEGSRHCMD